MKEETNLDVKLTGLISVYNNMFDNFNSISFIYSSEITKNKGITFDKNEIIEEKWFEFEELKNMKEQLRDYDYDYVIESISRYKSGDIKPLNTVITR